MTREIALNVTWVISLIKVPLHQDQRRGLRDDGWWWWFKGQIMHHVHSQREMTGRTRCQSNMLQETKGKGWAELGQVYLSAQLPSGRGRLSPAPYKPTQEGGSTADEDVSVLFSEPVLVSPSSRESLLCCSFYHKAVKHSNCITFCENPFSSRAPRRRPYCRLFWFLRPALLCRHRLVLTMLLWWHSWVIDRYRLLYFFILRCIYFIVRSYFILWVDYRNK